MCNIDYVLKLKSVDIETVSTKLQLPVPVTTSRPTMDKITKL